MPRRRPTPDRLYIEQQKLFRAELDSAHPDWQEIERVHRVMSRYEQAEALRKQSAIDQEIADE